MKVLVTGAQGQLGSDVCKVLSDNNITYLGIDHDTLDLCDVSEVKMVLNDYCPDKIIHCAAYTDVDRAQDDVEMCMAINHTATRTIAEICRGLGATMVYISTDYVFDGMKQEPYTTLDKTNPLNVYGASKLLGESVVRNVVEKHYILRTSWLYGANGRNFVQTILRLANEKDEISVVNDQIGAPTYTVDLAKAVLQFERPVPYGTYHITSEGACSWAEFAQDILNTSKIERCRIVPVTGECYPTIAKRPRNSCLDTSALTEVGISKLSSWRNALHRYLANR